MKYEDSTFLYHFGLDFFTPGILSVLSSMWLFSKIITRIIIFIILIIIIIVIIITNVCFSFLFLMFFH